MKISGIALPLAISCAMATCAFAQNGEDRFIDDLMSKMTLEEKIGQLNLLPSGTIQTGLGQNSGVAETIRKGELGAILSLKGASSIREVQKIAVEQTRLGIPLLFGMDVIHGYETIFPLPIAMSCSWDLEGIENAASISAAEASTDGISWVYSPMVDVAPDARWGRISEGNGEDPFLSGEIASAMVRGYQGDGTYPKGKVMACLKHYALYGAGESGLDYNTVDMSHARMLNQFMLPYRKAVEAGVGSVMTSFNLVDGVPATGSDWLVDHLLREMWKFGGFVVTDYGSIGEMVNHGIGEIQDVAVQALKAGTDMDMCAEAYVKTLKKSLEEGKITEQDIDKACRRVLKAKYRLGLFDDPYKFCREDDFKTEVYSDKNRQSARKMASESMVLLKNDNILPLEKKGAIALIGPLADTPYIIGTWAVTANYKRGYSTLKEGFERALKGKAELLYAQGCNICSDAALQEAGAFYRAMPRGDDEALLKEALEVASRADVIVCAMGEEQEMSGESSSRASLEPFDVQARLLRELKALGKPIVLLNFSGRPTVLTWESENIPAIMQVWFGGSECADAVCDVLFGDSVPCGKLTASFPRTTGQEPLYYNHLPTGRPLPEGEKSFTKFKTNYLDVRNDPLYCFGYGLSYTTFGYSDLTLSSSQMSKDGSIKAEITVTNTGNRDAWEVAQLYIHDIYASISRPVKELKGFQRIYLKAGESRRISFEVTPDMLSFYNNKEEKVLESGDFEIMVGPDSRDSSLRKAVLTLE